MARFFQYQNKTEPVTVPAAVVAVVLTTTEIFFPRSIIYQAKAEPVFVPVEAVTVDKWFEPLSEPVRLKRIQEGLFAFVQTPVVETAVTSVSDWTIFPRSFIYQSKAYSPFTAAAETITVDKWFRPLSDPVRVKRFPASEQQSLAFQFPFPTAPIGAVPTYLEGPPSSVRLLQYQSVAFPVPIVENVTIDKWFAPLSEPVRISRLPVSEQQSFAAPSTVITPIELHPWADPALTKRFPTAEQQAFIGSPFTPEVITVDKWFAPLAEPTRRKISEAGQPTAQAPFVESIEWFEPLSEPTRRKISEARQPTAQAPFIEDAALLTKWFQPLSEPARRKASETSRESLAWGVFTPSAEAIFEDKWHQAWSEPVRTRRLATAEQQFLAWSTFTPAAEIITEDKWHQAWSEPVRVRRFPTSEQRAHFAPEATIPRTEATVVVAQTPTVIFPRSIIYQSLAWAPYPIAAPVVTFYPMVFGDTGLLFEKTIVYQVSAEAPVEDVYESKWHQPWSEPLRFRRTAHLQPALNWSGFTPPPEVIFEDKWHEPWSEPVRTKRFPTSEQRAYFAPDATLPHAEAAAITTQTPAVTFPRSIIYQSVAWAPYPISVEVIFEDKWHQPWSEPVRQKRGLWAWLQQFFSTSTVPIVTPDVTVVIDATETNDDTAEFYAVVYNRPVRCYISIKEMPRVDRAYASFEET